MRDPAPLFRTVREAIAAHVAGERYHPTPFAPPWYLSRGVFVTLRSPDGSLRGCIGHLEPYCRTLADEIATAAVSAAREDPRFPPVSADELPTLELELSLLEPSELIEDRSTLDAHVFGVIVSSGKRRGVLLPNVVDGVDEQIQIATRKAGIRDGDPVQIHRFAVTKLTEER